METVFGSTSSRTHMPRDAHKTRKGLYVALGVAAALAAGALMYNSAYQPFVYPVQTHTTMTQKKVHKVVQKTTTTAQQKVTTETATIAPNVQTAPQVSTPSQQNWSVPGVQQSTPSYVYNIASNKINFVTPKPFASPAVIVFKDANVNFTSYTPVATMNGKHTVNPRYSTASVLDNLTIKIGGVVATPFENLDMKANAKSIYTTTLSDGQSISFNLDKGAKISLSKTYNDADALKIGSDYTITADEAKSLNDKTVVYTVQQGSQSFLVPVHVAYAKPVQAASLPNTTFAQMPAFSYANIAHNTSVVKSLPKTQTEYVTPPLEDVVGSSVNINAAPVAPTTEATRSIVATDVQYSAPKSEFSMRTPQGAVPIKTVTPSVPYIDWNKVVPSSPLPSGVHAIPATYEGTTYKPN